MTIARGVIITVSVLVAAGIAAYENPQVRQWVEKSREKIAIALHSLGDEIRPQSNQANRNDPSMREDQSEKAEEIRRQKREEILEKGRLMEERRNKRKASSQGSEINEKRSPSFDSLVDDDGKLRPNVSSPQPVAESSAVEPQDMTGSLRSRHTEQPRDIMHESVDAPMLLRQFEGPHAGSPEPWESQYEREMRNTWNIPLPERSAVPSTHASESLVDLTPTTEDFPDPAVSIPSATDLEHPLDRTEYFSIPGSRSSRTMSEADDLDFHYPHLNQSLTPLEPRPVVENTTHRALSSAAGSMAGSIAHIDLTGLDSEDDMSEFGDGIRTPASVWTDVGSTVSGDN